MMEVHSRKILHILVYRILIPVVALAAILYAVFAPPSFQMGADYVFHSVSPEHDLAVIQAPGGKTLLGPSVIRLWGKYPYVCGTTGIPDAPFFSLDMENHAFRTFESEEDEDFRHDLERAGCTADEFVSLRELFERDDRSKRRRMLLRELLRPPVRKNQ